MNRNEPIFCEVRYDLDPQKLEQFKEYGRTWIKLIERCGGAHHGYFLPRPAPKDASISFPVLGQTSGGDKAIALFSFPSEEAYQNFRTQAASDPDVAAANERFAEPPFHSYERAFFSLLSR